MIRLYTVCRFIYGFCILIISILTLIRRRALAKFFLGILNILSLSFLNQTDSVYETKYKKNERE